MDYGVADVGVVGKDTLMEENRRCTSCWTWGLASAGCAWRGSRSSADKLITSSHFRVATKYPAIARRFYEERGENVEIISRFGRAGAAGGV